MKKLMDLREDAYVSHLSDSSAEITVNYICGVCGHSGEPDAFLMGISSDDLKEYIASEVIES